MNDKMKYIQSYLTPVLLYLTLFLSSCSPEDIEKNDKDDKTIKFIYNTMKEVYYWVDKSAIKTTMLADYADPHKYFEAILYKPTDRYSVLRESEALKTALAAQNKGVFGFKYSNETIDGKKTHCHYPSHQRFTNI